MGYDVSLVSKTRNEDISFKIHECENKRKISFLTRRFAMFQSRNFENSEFIQVENILQIDLSIYLKYPNNTYDPHDLEYELYKAEEAKNQKGIDKVKDLIEKGRKEWEDTYEENNDGWTTVQEFRIVTKEFIEKMKQNPDFGEKIVTPKGWDYPWNGYFSFTPLENEFDDRLIDDLETLLKQLECIEEQGIEYVGFVGR